MDTILMIVGFTMIMIVGTWLISTIGRKWHEHDVRVEEKAIVERIEAEANYEGPKVTANDVILYRLLAGHAWGKEREGKAESDDEIMNKLQISCDREYAKEIKLLTAP